MAVFSSEIDFSTDGDGTIVDITGEVAGRAEESGLSEGLVSVFVPGSTGALTTVEYEPGLLRDLPALFEKLVPSGKSYHHDQTWGDGNGFSHLRASLVGPSLCVPLCGGDLVLGTWQQIIFLEFDNRPRRRSLRVTVVGE